MTWRERFRQWWHLSDSHDVRWQDELIIFATQKHQDGFDPPRLLEAWELWFLMHGYLTQAEQQLEWVAIIHPRWRRGEFDLTPPYAKAEVKR